MMFKKDITGLETDTAKGRGNARFTLLHFLQKVEGQGLSQVKGSPLCAGQCYRVPSAGPGQPGKTCRE